MGKTHPIAKTPGDIQIAGSRTIHDWQVFRATLVPGGEPVLWRRAFDDYFHERLSSRYLGPIKVLQDNGSSQGEGFSILAIHFSIIEFLESTLHGLSYRHKRRNDPPLGQYEYSDSGRLFANFLSRREPFAKSFDNGLATDFYVGVRCALLHEARTRKGWTIKAKGPAGTVVDAQERIVYRNNFHDAFVKFIKWYKGALPADRQLQEAFIRKFNSLCE